MENLAQEQKEKLQDNLQEYALYAKTKKYQELVKKTTEDIKIKLSGLTVFDSQNKIGVSLSMGKDSVVMLDILYKIWQNKIYPCFFDSGAEFPESLELLEILESKYNNLEFTTVDPEINIWQIYKKCGWWGYKGFDKEEIDFTAEQVKSILIREPAKTAIDALHLDVFCIGLRKEESKGREIFLNKGNWQYPKYSKVPLYYPLADWSYKDIWAYIASQNLPYNKIYDYDLILDKDESRVGSYLGTSKISKGRLLTLRLYHPEIYNRVISTFPMIREIQ